MRRVTLAFILGLFSFPAWSDVTVRFEESAPKDRFTITNSGACPLDNIVVTIDLGASAAGLIFDVTGTGAGVSVFQPLEFVAGQDFLTHLPEVRDGDTQVDLALARFDAGARLAFTIDVDDTAGVRATMISGSEIAGARVGLSGVGQPMEAVFGADAKAVLPTAACTS